MTMTGQGDSQPVDGASALDDLAAALTPQSEQDDEQERDADPNASEGDEGEPEEVDSDEEQSEEAEESEAEDDPTVKIVHDGKEVELKLSEAKELAQKGFDYQKKTMALAEERKAAETEKAHAAQLRQQTESALSETIGRLEAFTKYMEAQVGDPPAIELAQYDAASFLAQKELYEQRKGQLQQAHAGIQHFRLEQQRQRQAQLSTQAQETVKALADTLPGWNESTLPELEKYAEKLGITLQSAADGYVLKGLWQALHKAKAYDAIQAKKAEMKPVKQLQKVNKPAASANTTGKQAERVKREAAFNKNPSVDALAALLR